MKLLCIVFGLVLSLGAGLKSFAEQTTLKHETMETTANPALESDNSQPVATDLELMEKYGTDLTRSIPALLEGLQSSDIRIRRNAAFGLGELGADGKPALQALANALRTDPDFEVRRNAAFALGEIGEPAIPALLSMLNDRDPRIRRTVTAALVRIGQPAVPKLIALLQSTDGTIRRNAAVILGGIGPQAGDALPALEKALHNPDKGFQWTVKQAIRKIRQLPSPEAPSEMRASDNQTAAPTRSEVNEAAAVPDHIAQLMARLIDEKSEVRRHAAFALAKIGTPALPALTQALQSENVIMRKNAAFALGEMGKDAHTAIPALVRLKQDPDTSVRWIAEHALKKIEGRREH